MYFRYIRQIHFAIIMMNLEYHFESIEYISFFLIVY